MFLRIQRVFAQLIEKPVESIRFQIESKELNCICVRKIDFRVGIQTRNECGPVLLLKLREEF